MKFKTQSPLHVLLFSLILIFQFSCSKDSDLLTDYVLADAKADLVIGKFVVDDVYTVSSVGSVVLDVLSNDTFTEQEEVTITETSTPTNGNVEINADDTLTFTPEANTPTSDTFTYTTEVVNEDQSVTTDVGTVTVTLSDRVDGGEIVLNTLKAFPSAFGAGANITGGRGQSIYAVTKPEQFRCRVLARCHLKTEQIDYCKSRGKGQSIKRHKFILYQQHNSLGAICTGPWTYHKRRKAHFGNVP